MLTRLKVRNFKRFDEIDVELGKSVVFIGPNNSGKTTALQALVLWDIGLRQWNAKRAGKASPEKRPGVAINRRDLFSIPVPTAKLLWRDLHVREGRTLDGKPKTVNIRIDIAVDGITNDTPWSCGLEFDYANEESFVCRPLRLPDYEDVRVGKGKLLEVPKEASAVRVAYLPPMSGLTREEPKWEAGKINVLTGQGETAQVLRNLCYQIHEKESSEDWNTVVERIRDLFGVVLLPPEYIAARGEITMEYEQNGTRLDISSSGRGLQQTLLLLAHLYANPETTLLLDEPDAHLEIFRQRQIYQLLTEVAAARNSQVIAASHSEVVLTEAAGRGKVIAFVGKPHTMNDRGNQLLKSLTDIGWDQYYQAEQAGWVLYVEGPTDLAILRAFARLLEHPAANHLERPFVNYVANNIPQRARDHFFGLREGKGNLAGIAIFDRLDKPLQQDSALVEMMWRRREIENYFCDADVLLAYARHEQPDDLFGLAERQRREPAMRAAIEEVTLALATLSKPGPWTPDIKATDDFLDPLFKKFFSALGLPLTFRKADYYELAGYVPRAKIDPEIVEKLDAICSVAAQAKPRNE